jgi:hypothetical protein
MLGSTDNIVLNILVQIRKINAVAGDPHHQSGVFFGMPLGINQNGLVDAIELDVSDSKIIQSRSEQIRKFPQTFFFEIQLTVPVIDGFRIGLILFFRLLHLCSSSFPFKGD